MPRLTRTDSECDSKLNWKHQVRVLLRLLQKDFLLEHSCSASKSSYNGWSIEPRAKRTAYSFLYVISF